MLYRRLHRWRVYEILIISRAVRLILVFLEYLTFNKGLNTICRVFFLLTLYLIVKNCLIVILIIFNVDEFNELKETKRPK